MRIIMRYFIDGAIECLPKHEFEYSHAAKMIIPRVGEYVWLPTYRTDDIYLGKMVCEIDKVEYNLYDDGSGIQMVNISCHDVTAEMLYEEDY